ncbi:hypothetical protein [Streptomyces melanogenes]|uniref:hypothetical protein n=1 Tax=Streptomyces melanogenes TaxID=67326 RepID=UPI00379BFC00
MTLNRSTWFMIILGATTATATGISLLAWLGGASWSNATLAGAVSFPGTAGFMIAAATFLATTPPEAETEGAPLVIPSHPAQQTGSEPVISE